MVVQRFGKKADFLSKVNPDAQTSFASKPDKAVMGDYPTLRDIDVAYGKGFASMWLVPQIDNLARYTGAKNLTEVQQEELARVIAADCRHLKITELLLFFYRFKTGRYGRFYGTVDPMVITCALREFVNERNIMIDKFIQEERERKAEEEKKPAVTWEEYCEMKGINKPNPLV